MAAKKKSLFGAQDLTGIIAPMTTPFTRKGDVDEGAFRKQVNFLIETGVHGLAVGGSTGEGHTLSTKEATRLVRIAMTEAKGRVPVVAGIIVDSTQQAIERAEAVADLGPAALQITPVHYLFRPDDNHMLEHFRTVGRATKIPILIYNVIPWSYLSPALLIRILKEIPQVVGVKQSAGDMKLLADLLLGAPKGSRIMSAVDALMYPSFAIGAHGAIAAILTAAPAAQVKLWDLVQAGEHEAARRLHEKLLVLWNAMIDDNLPATVKFALSEQGVPGGYPRAPMPAASTAQQRAIGRALKKLI
ncbi:MAG: dihydrodipicolinate synthase family protein [Rhodospirillaceae bacterium]|jgi:4-hydroxy-tetrahydrodipicolinate synthase|nr:dihydrodipicolinate synthase family protein [Rhodospirillaceae bacterium]MBT4043294.1 dihydrodipicolinate synthase family protein [Rhodospirillaceae bacterium]MBT4688742.1 dihydrodipicolinate synthase family protein [Rhodospirillaceae bacterium]MBT5083432.1 dihydrodipicolinate synthase family protein [Rhodospirillaceae bacterium]MBT5525518.1 dihydrodipicolinate synthase family protein [Rhodospirillaceae bacterium]